MQTFEALKSHARVQANSKQGQPFFAPSAIQPKLTINEPGDKYEQEADVMAERVMRMETTGGAPVDEEQPIQAMPLAISRLQRQESEEEESVQMMPLPIQRKCAACEQEEQVQTMPLMRKSEGGGYQASPQLTSQLSQSKGGGSSLTKPTMSYMNQTFGADFSNVRVHTGSQAQEMSQGIQAKAFTHGADVYFNKGQYNPESSDGKRLLAHELTHVVQQTQEDGRKIQRRDWGVLGGSGCNYSPEGREWALTGDGIWQSLQNGCTGFSEDCDGMTCGGGFYYISNLQRGECRTPRQDDRMFAPRRWTPTFRGAEAMSPTERGSQQGDTPPEYVYDVRP